MKVQKKTEERDRKLEQVERGGRQREQVREERGKRGGGGGVDREKEEVRLQADQL